jgi:hypothetical protein
MNEIRVDSMSFDRNEVRVLFNVRTGYYALSCNRGRIIELREERSIHTFSEAEQKVLKSYTRIVYAMLHGADELENETN